ncbi:hypothetical protein, partial [Bacillus cereus]|uniref:hypothetical protein n=1 Tax=Bacillus cereus TaxID=1396 RepID=UPI0034D61B2C
MGDPSNELAKQAAKQQQEIKKDIFSRAKTNSIPYDSFKMDDPLHQQEILQRVMEKEHQNDVFNSTKKQGEMVDIEDKYIGKQA